ncbi:EamA family transporter [Pseudalkalibacillus caeni]|uniref:DMT family transporter n=1 Tax=Exobacillus caeni TaxID=2574798 RepID=A0A5R9F1M4_9BACL|nr:DMT family transporter [Pseudalkalibacillus caeni]TLS37542.1 DMT family transporter [Pseudalkalibacillus caeni]
MRYIMMVSLGACCYGVLSTIVKLAYNDGLRVDEVVGSQMVIGVLLLWMITVFTSNKRSSLKEACLLLFVGATTGLTGIFYYNSLRFVDASFAVILLFQFTWIGVLIESLWKRQRPSKGRILALILLMAGTYLASGIHGTGIQEFSLIGILLGLGAALCYSLFILFSGSISIELNPWVRGSLLSSGGMVITLLVYPPSFMMGINMDTMLWGGLLALLGVVVPTVLFTTGVPKIGGGMAAILGAAELPMAIFASSLLLRERVTFLQWVGVVVILLGIILPELNRKKYKHSPGEHKRLVS